MNYRSRLIQVTECRVKLFLLGNVFNRVDEFYAARLRLEEIHRWREPDSRGVMFRLGPNTILELLDDRRSGSVVSACGLSLAVDDVWNLYQELADSDVSAGPLKDRAWGDTSFQIEDPSGFSIVFFSKTSQKRCEGP
jgi:uncharacterized glyoxalase superfamily protein PhnB